jgi:hypothetical protein
MDANFWFLATVCLAKRRYHSLFAGTGANVACSALVFRLARHSMAGFDRSQLVAAFQENRARNRERRDADRARNVGGTLGSRHTAKSRRRSAAGSRSVRTLPLRSLPIQRTRRNAPARPESRFAPCLPRGAARGPPRERHNTRSGNEVASGEGQHASLGGCSTRADLARPAARPH